MQIPIRVPAIILTAAGATYLAYKARNFPTTTGASLSAPFSSTAAGAAASSLAAASIASSSTTAATNHSMARGAVIALSHGGGPLPVLGDPDSAELAASLRTRVPAILGLDDPARRPKAIILVTAHWSERRPTISAAEKNSLLYDYGGFPAESYRLKYPARGSPEVAKRVATVLADEGLKPQLDLERGWDHGVFVPMLLVRPQADIPVVQVSVLASEDPAEHFAMGRALAKLRDENIAIVGSGFASFHNLRLMFSGITRDPTFHSKLAEWNDAITEAVEVPEAQKRDGAFREWRKWPASYAAHPQYGAEHFLPLVVCAGAGGDVAGKKYVDDYLGLDIFSYYWD